MPLHFVKVLVASVAVAVFSCHVSYAMWARTSDGPLGAQLADSGLENIRANESNGSSAGTEQASKSNNFEQSISAESMQKQKRSRKASSEQREMLMSVTSGKKAPKRTAKKSTKSHRRSA